MSKNILRSELTRLARIARRVPRALAAALAAFLSTMRRPEPPPAGSAAFLAQFRVEPGQFVQVLEMFLDDRAVRPRRLRQRYGNAGGTNLLSVCEVLNFINKPGGRWVVDFARIQAHLARHGRETSD